MCYKADASYLILAAHVAFPKKDTLNSDSRAAVLVETGLLRGLHEKPPCRRLREARTGEDHMIVSKRLTCDRYPTVT